MIKIALVTLLAAAAISHPIGEPLVGEKITHSKPVITEEYGPAEVINEEEAHRLIMQYMNQANQRNQMKKLNWHVSNAAANGGSIVLGDSVSSGAAISAEAPAAHVSAPAAHISAPAVSSAAVSAPAVSTYTMSDAALSAGHFAPGSNFYLARPGGLQWLGQNGLAALAKLAAPKTYTTTQTSFVNSAPAHAQSFRLSAPTRYQTETVSTSAAAPALTQSFQYVNAAPAVTTTTSAAAPALTQSFQYVNAAPAVTTTTVNAEATPAISSYNFAAPAAAAAVDVAPQAPAVIQLGHKNAIFTADDSPLNEIMQEKDFGAGASHNYAQIEQVKDLGVGASSSSAQIEQVKDLGFGASSTSAQIEQVKTPVTAETFTFGNKESVNRVGTKY